MSKSRRLLFLLFRWLLAVGSILLFIAAVRVTFRQWSVTSLALGINDIPYNELTKESITNRVELSRSLFQVGLLVIAALWGLIIGKKGEAGIVFSNGPEVLMFLSASLLLLISLGAHSYYVNSISAIYASAGQALNKTDPTMPDAFDPNINNFYIFQIRHLIFGFAVAVATLFSAHKLKEDP